MPNQYTGPTSLADRFWSKVNIGATDECWVWQAAIDRRGYGVFLARIDPSRPKMSNQFAHRIAYLLANGELPRNLAVCHSCDNPPCVNPKHLWLGTLKDNTRDMWRKGRHMPIPKRFLPGDCAGEKNSHAKLTAEQVVDIRNAAANNVPTSKLMHQYGVCRTAIRKIVRRDTWSHIP